MTAEPHSCEAQLLSKEWRDERDGLRLYLWATSETHPVHITLTRERAVMFLERERAGRADERKPVGLRTLGGRAVDALYFLREGDLQAEAARLKDAGTLAHEADIKPVDRFLMERFITGSLKVTGPAEERDGVLCFTNPRVERSDFKKTLRLLALDIETEGLDGKLLSIAGICEGEARVFMLAEGNLDVALPSVSYLGTELAVIEAFCDWVRTKDPDLLIGWNVVAYDLRLLWELCRKAGRSLRLGRQGAAAEVMIPKNPQQPFAARVPGRVVLDGIATLRSATWAFESFALEDVAQELLGRGKKIDHVPDPVAEIMRLYHEHKAGLVAYNLEDCQLVLDIFERANLIRFVVERQALTGLALDRQGGSVAAFDYLYLPRLHRAGFVANARSAASSHDSAPGGFVMESKPGLYQNVLLLDFKSLYPSIIRTFCIDPLGLAQPGEDPVPGFAGARFSRERHILPGLIESLWAARDDAKAKKDKALSQAIKILMNSFYGVLGTPGCRFASTELVTSITRRGHEILGQTSQFIEAQGYSVIYGDTDSVFVHVGGGLEAHACQTLGQELARKLNHYFEAMLSNTFRLPCYLEVEFEAHYQEFVMPTLRGSERGSKKRYAGAWREPNGELKITFKGLEAVRTDWTPLARNFQRELYRRIFLKEPYEELIRETCRALRAGRLDAELVYRKRLRRELSEYVANVPPHVQAARKQGQASRSVEYLITLAGPEPVGHLTAAIDYEHYVERQLEPIVDGILHFLGRSFAEVAGSQMRLFS
ncbi:MAG: DNA polymerase II [Polyangiaceae bacterium]|nr:DNA polymerase II [Polyangiaceae bacterium]